MRIQVSVDNQTVLDALNRLIEAGANPRPVLLEIGEDLLLFTKRRFVTQTGPDGAGWAANSPITLAIKGAKPPLIDERTLSQQIFYQVTGATLELGSNLVYAAVQQFGAAQGSFGHTRRGAPIPWGDIPARPYLGVSEEDEQTILAVISDYLADQVDQ